jgi:lactate dehydrogenase-like 2-hydroxyacid dehydrogenase
MSRCCRIWASSTIEARTGMGKKVIANIAAFVEGRPLPDAIQPSP